MAFFKMELALRFPNEIADKSDLRNYYGDVDYAITQFNEYYSDREIIFFDISKNKIIVLLETPKEKITAREITYFSKRLHHDRNWKRFSKQDTKLLKADVQKITENEFEKYLNIIKEEDVGEKLEEIEIMTDEQAIEALKGLIVIKSIGGEEIKKERERNLNEIKKILFETLN